LRKDLELIADKLIAKYSIMLEDDSFHTHES